MPQTAKALTVHIGSTGPPVVPPPTGLPMLFGASQADYDALHTNLNNPTGSKAGGVGFGLQVRRSYDTGTTPSNWGASQASGDVARGCASYLSIGGETPATLASGSRATAITAFFASIPAGHTVFLTYWHEVDLKGYTTTEKADFRTSQVNLHNYLVASGADLSLVKLGPLLTSSGYGQNGADAGGSTDFFPTDTTKFDFVAVDFYEFWRPPGSPVDPKTGTLGNNRPPDYFLATALAFANASGKPLLIGEYGAHPFPAHPSYLSGGVVDTTSRPYRLQRVVDYLDTAGCLAVCYFHSSAGGSGPWWLDDFHNFTTPTDRSTPDPDTVTQARQIISVRAPTPG